MFAVNEWWINVSDGPRAKTVVVFFSHIGNWKSTVASHLYILFSHGKNVKAMCKTWARKVARAHTRCACGIGSNVAMFDTYADDFIKLISVKDIMPKANFLCHGHKSW